MIICAAPACEAPRGEKAEVQLAVLSLTFEPQFEVGDVPTLRPGTYWTAVEVELRNATDRDLPLSFAMFRLAAGGGVAQEASAATELLPGACTAGSYVVGGAAVSCRLAFVLDEEELPLAIAYGDPDSGAEATADIEVCPPDRPDLCSRRCVDLAADPRACDVPADNVAACEAFEDSVWCGGADLSAALDCQSYAQSRCDAEPYFECLAENTTCSSGGTLQTGWAPCYPLADCDD